MRGLKTYVTTKERLVLAGQTPPIIFENGRYSTKGAREQHRIEYSSRFGKDIFLHTEDETPEEMAQEEIAAEAKKQEDEGEEGDEEFECDVCAKKFLTKKQLTGHMISHRRTADSE